MGEPEDLWLLATDAGYGFTVRLKELITDRKRRQDRAQRAGERARAAAGARRLAGFAGASPSSSEGKMLAFKVSDLPEMPRGKGNKIYDIPGKKAAAREEMLTGIAVVPPGGKLVLWSGEKQKTLEWKELEGLSRPARAARRRADARLAQHRPARGASTPRRPTHDQEIRHRIRLC